MVGRLQIYLEGEWTMPYYRNGDEDYPRKPKMRYDKDCEHKWEEDEDEDEDMMEDRKCHKRPCVCEFECPFKVIVKLIPCEEHKRRMPM
jgi:hypothetical protein